MLRASHFVFHICVALLGDTFLLKMYYYSNMLSECLSMDWNPPLPLGMSILDTMHIFIMLDFIAKIHRDHIRKFNIEKYLAKL